MRLAFKNLLKTGAVLCLILSSLAYAIPAGRSTRSSIHGAGDVVGTQFVYPALAGGPGSCLITRDYGPGIWSCQPYAPVGPFIDGILVPAYLANQYNEWSALKNGAIDVYDWGMTKAQLAEWNANGCVAAPDASAGKGGCPADQGPIQSEIALANVQALDKYEIDFQNAKFPSNVQAFRWAIAWITDKESFDTNQLGGFGAPDYTAIACPILCQTVAPFQWVDQSLLSSTALANHVYGAGLPIAARIATANSILDAAGFTVGSGGVRVNNRADCASDPGGCGAPLTPFFYVRGNDPERLALGQSIKAIMAAPVPSGLGIQMIAGCTGNSGAYPYANNYCEMISTRYDGSIFFNFNFNMYTAGWGLQRDPTYLDDLYDSRFITPGNTNYVNYADPAFDTAARALRAATNVPDAISAAHAAEIEYNRTLPVLEVYTHQAPFAYRIFHSDPDSVLNGLQWTSFELQTGTGWHNRFTLLNAQLVGAPLHDPNHPVFLKLGFKTDILEKPNPIDSGFPWDIQALGLSHDTLNAVATDDLSFGGDLPWMASLPVTTMIASGEVFPDGSTCTPDAPATGCSVLAYQLRPDLSFAAALDGSVPAIPVSPDDVRFSILLGRDSPTSFVSPAYFHVQNVLTHTSNPKVVTDPLRFLVEERNQAVWDRHDIGGTIVVSMQHWCQEARATTPAWGAHTAAQCIAGVTPSTGVNNWVASVGGYPDATVNVVGVGAGDAFGTGAPSSVDMGSFAFVYDSQGSSASAGPMLFRTRMTPGEALPTPYAANAPNDGYFTNIGGTTFAINGVQTGWYKFHQAGNVNWYCTSCPGGETGPLPASDMVINIVDLAVVTSHFCITSGCAPLTGAFGHQPWDLSGPAGLPDSKIDIFDLTRVALHFGQSYLGGTDIGGGTIGVIPGWVAETIPGT